TFKTSRKIPANYTLFRNGGPILPSFYCASIKIIEAHEGAAVLARKLAHQRRKAKAPHAVTFGLRQHDREANTVNAHQALAGGGVGLVDPIHGVHHVGNRIVGEVVAEHVQADLAPRLVEGAN